VCVVLAPLAPARQNRYRYPSTKHAQLTLETKTLHSMKLNSLTD
jgi:hypothetical protein